MKEKPLKLQKDGTIIKVSSMSDDELIKSIKIRLKDKNEKMAEIKNIHKEAVVSIILSAIVNIVLFVYCLYLLFNVASTFLEKIGIVSVYIFAPVILKGILTVLIKTRHKEGYQELKEQTSIDSLKALCRQSSKILNIYDVRCVYNEFIDTEEFGDIDDIDDEIKETKLIDFFKELILK